MKWQLTRFPLTGKPGACVSEEHTPEEPLDGAAQGSCSARSRCPGMHAWCEQLVECLVRQQCGNQRYPGRTIRNHELEQMSLATAHGQTGCLETGPCTNMLSGDGVPIMVGDGVTPG